MGSSNGDGMTRRGLLQGLVAGGALAAVPGTALAGRRRGESHDRRREREHEHDDECRAKGVTVFRISTRGTRTCRACKNFHKYNIFISRARADRGRPHPGCNCPVTMQKIPKEVFRRLFLDTGLIREGAVDLRTLGKGEGSGRGRRRRGAMRRAG